MLPNHAPLTVAERFKVLEALFPGRIDLGIGRAPGTDQITSVALRRRQDIRDDDDFLERLQEMLLIESKGFPDKPSVLAKCARCRPTFRCRRFFCSDRATTAHSLPPRSARDFLSRIISRAMTPPTRCDAIATISAPRRCLQKPHAILAVAADVRRQAKTKPSALPRLPISISCAARTAIICRSKVRRRRSAYPYTPIDRDRIAQNRERLFVGTPAAVKTRLETLADSDGGG